MATAPARFGIVAWRSHGSALLQGRPWWAVQGLCLLVLWLRRPDLFANPQFWAEDGMFFHTEFLWGGRSFLVAYNGYFHTVPRIIASTAASLHPGLIPAFYVWAAIACTLYLCARTLSARFPLPVHAGYALAVVLVPDAFEVLLNVANLQSILSAGLVVLLISRDPATPGQKIHDLLAAGLLGLTGPFSILLFPLFLVRLWQRRTRWSAIIAIPICLTALIQGYAFTHFPASVVNEGTLMIGHSVGAGGLRTVGSILLGRWLQFPVALPFTWMLSGLALASYATLAWRAGPGRAERILMAGAAVLFVVGALYRCRFTANELHGWGTGARYFFAAQVLFLWLLLAGFNAGHMRWRIVAAGATILILFANLPRLREPALHDFRWGDYVGALRAGEAVDIPINPPGWKIPVPARSER